MKKHLTPADRVVIGYGLLMTVGLFIFWNRLQEPSGLVLLGCHASIFALISLSAYAHAQYGGRFWNIVHHWAPYFALLAAFKEVQYLAPQIQPFDDWHWDLYLYNADIALFGNVGTWLRKILWVPAVDFFTICYWTYYPLVIYVPFFLWRRGAFHRYQEVLTVYLFSFFVSYIGYYIIPAVGPHLLEQEHFGMARDTVWKGTFSGTFYQLLTLLEGRTPDGFPSGHALLAATFIFTAWRHRVHTPIVTFFSIGIILSTVYLRYHYIVDLLASAILLPFCWYGGLWIYRKSVSLEERPE